MTECIHKILCLIGLALAAYSLFVELKHSEDPGGIMTCVGGLANYLSENFYLLPKRNFEKKKVEGLS